MDKKWQQYSYLKNLFLQKHPDCTREELDAACKKFLEQLEL